MEGRAGVIAEKGAGGAWSLPPGNARDRAMLS
jgi:hypothetical protein